MLLRIYVRCLNNKMNILRLRDTMWGNVCAPNKITCSVQSHLTMATKDGAQVENHLMHVHTQPEGIAYLV